MVGIVFGSSAKKNSMVSRVRLFGSVVVPTNDQVIKSLVGSAPTPGGRPVASAARPAS